MDTQSALVSTEWLAEHLNAPDVRIVDASWYLPGSPRDPRAEYEAEHIPGAVFFDIDEIADPDTDLPHMLPSPEKFSSRMRTLGIGDGNRVIVYDAGGPGEPPSAARVWWTLRTFGHTDVAILNGGLAKWKAEGREVDDHPPAPTERHFTARLNTLMVRDLDQVRRNIDERDEQVVDARSRGRFKATEPEPRPELRRGHIPGSVCLPFNELLNSDWTYKSADEVRAAFEAEGVDLRSPIITTCGSGITASVLALALHEAGAREVAVYDGSWTEWGSRDDTPIADEPIPSESE